MYVSSILTPEYTSASGLTGIRRAMAIFLLGGLLTVLYAAPALAGKEFSPPSIGKGVLLVASPSLEDPNFRQAVVLVVEHGSEGTVGLILNRSTNVLLSKALPDIAALKATNHRLYAGGPVEPTRFLLLFRLKEPPADARSIFDGVYLGRTPKALEDIITRAKPTESFRAFAGFAAWAPRQLEAEMRLGAWAILPPDSSSIFDKDTATLWQGCLSRLQAPRGERVAWVVPGAHGTPTIKRWSLNVRNGDHTSRLAEWR
jgi:putative transcriptional regulator